MAKYNDAKCKLCRREGTKLFLKGDRCLTDKCAIDRREYPPGQHGHRRSKLSEYGIQLREKQKVRRSYGILERQFRHYFKEADRIKGETGANLLILLERRLDNVVYKLSMASTLAEARQLVAHGHFKVRGRKVDIPSFLVKPGDVIEVRPKSRNIDKISSALGASERRGIPSWLELEKEEFRGTVKSVPLRDDVTMPIEERLIVELYSK